MARPRATISKKRSFTPVTKSLSGAHTSPCCAIAWSFRRLTPPPISTPIVHEQMDFLRDHGIEIILKDLSFGGVLPCLGRLLRRSQHSRGIPVPAFPQSRRVLRPGGGACCGLSPSMRRAGAGHEFISGQTEDREVQVARLLDARFSQLCPASRTTATISSPRSCLALCRIGTPISFAPGSWSPSTKGRNTPTALMTSRTPADICETLGKDYMAVDLTDPEFGFPVAQVIVPGYSDVLPFHPAESRGLFHRWTRTEVLHSYSTR